MPSRRLVLALTFVVPVLHFQTLSAQPARIRVAVDVRGNGPVATAFARALENALRASDRLMPAPDNRDVDISLVAVSTPVRCEGQTIAAIAIGAHRPGRVQSSLWVNVVISDEAHAGEYAGRVLADLSAALITDKR